MNVQSEWGTKIRSLKDNIPFKLFLGTFLIYVFCNNGIGWGSASERTRYAQIKAIVEDEYGCIWTVGGLFIIMPRNKMLINTLFLRFLDHFPLLQRLLDICRYHLL